MVEIIQTEHFLCFVGPERMLAIPGASTQLSVQDDSTALVDPDVFLHQATVLSRKQAVGETWHRQAQGCREGPGVQRANYLRVFESVDRAGDNYIPNLNRPNTRFGHASGAYVSRPSLTLQEA